MKQILLTTITIFIIICGCNNTPKVTNRQQLAVTQENDSIKLHRIVLPNDSGVVFIDFADGKIKEKIRKDSNQTVILEFNPGDSTYLSAILSSKDSIANIRFSQIIMPDSTADGPFGREIEYELTQKGTYKLLIHENMMAGDPWSGVFMVKAKLSNNKK